MFDPNLIARKVLWTALRNHAGAERRYRADLFRAWREARAAAKTRPEPRVKLGARVQAPTLTPEQLSRIGKLDGLVD